MKAGRGLGSDVSCLFEPTGMLSRCVGRTQISWWAGAVAPDRFCLFSDLIINMLQEETCVKRSYPKQGLVLTMEGISWTLEMRWRKKLNESTLGGKWV